MLLFEHHVRLTLSNVIGAAPRSSAALDLGAGLGQATSHPRTGDRPYARGQYQPKGDRWSIIRYALTPPIARDKESTWSSPELKRQKKLKEEPLERQLWKTADKLRKNIDAAEYKHVVLGLIFLKYISDAFEEMFNKRQAGEAEYAGADPEDKNEYKADNIFFVPPEAHWSFLLAKRS